MTFIPYLANMEFKIAGGGMAIEQIKIPDISVQRFDAWGDLEEIQIEIQSVGHPAAQLEFVSIRIGEFLSDLRRIAMEVIYSSDSRKVNELLEPLEMESLLPEWFNINELEGDINGSLTMEGTLSDKFKLEEWRVNHLMQIRNFHSSTPLEEVFYQYLDVDLSNQLKGGALETDFSIKPNGFGYDILAIGNPVLSGNVFFNPNGDYSIDCEIDLNEFETHLSEVSKNISKGEHSVVRLKSKGNLGITDGNVPDLLTEIQAENLFLEQLTFSLHSIFKEKFSGDLGGIDSVDLIFNGMNTSDLNIQAGWNENSAFVLSLESKLFNLGPLLTQLEPLVLNILGDSESTESHFPKDDSLCEDLVVSVNENLPIENNIPVLKLPKILLDLKNDEFSTNYVRLTLITNCYRFSIYSIVSFSDSSVLQITTRVAIPEEEIVMQAVRSQGAGGQNVNKVSTAIHLFFNIHASSLSEYYKKRLLSYRHHHINDSGMIVIKAQEHRTQAKNREQAIQLLKDLILAVTAPRKKRKATKPTQGSKERRIRQKKQLGEKKQMRTKPDLS
jgi:ribosome-associated protein